MLYWLDYKIESVGNYFPVFQNTVVRDLNTQSLTYQASVLTIHQISPPILFTNHRGSCSQMIVHQNSLVQIVCRRCGRILGFIMRLTRGNTSLEALSIIYSSLVKQLKELSSTVWSPYLKGLILINEMQKIHNWFVCRIPYRQVLFQKLANFMELPLKYGKESKTLCGCTIS